MLELSDITLETSCGGIEDIPLLQASAGEGIN
jgi:hypothetical protein